jgi:hypothetical protein
VELVFVMEYDLEYEVWKVPLLFKHTRRRYPHGTTA